jgi:hypothetical protein
MAVVRKMMPSGGFTILQKHAPHHIKHSHVFLEMENIAVLIEIIFLT